MDTMGILLKGGMSLSRPQYKEWASTLAHLEINTSLTLVFQMSSRRIPPEVFPVFSFRYVLGGPQVPPPSRGFGVWKPKDLFIEDLFGIC